MKIILDDQRYVPADTPYNLVRTYAECVEMLRLFRNVSYISLDYNLGSVKTGYDVLVYMKENNIQVRHINIHSNHILGVPKMQAYAWDNFPGVEITCNPLNFR